MTKQLKTKFEMYRINYGIDTTENHEYKFTSFGLARLITKIRKAGGTITAITFLNTRPKL